MRLQDIVTSSLVIITLLLTGCSSSVPEATADETPAVETAAPTPTETRVPESTPDPFPGDGPWEVHFETQDGAELTGTLYGEAGSTGLLLVPMYPGGAAGWDAFAEQAEAQGYRVLTFELRGHDASSGPISIADAPEDISAAASFMRSEGIDKIVLIGAGEGGTAAILAADESDSSAIAVISSPLLYNDLEVTSSDLASLDIPSLWIGSRQDMTQNVETMYEQAGSSEKSVWIFEGSSLHGTYLFEGADSADLTARLFDFIGRVTES